MHGVHHSAADVDRLYAPCSDGGRGLQQIELTYQSCIVRLNCYLAHSSDPFIQMIREYDFKKILHLMKRMACRFTAQLRRSLASDDTSQSLHRNASISVEGGYCIIAWHYTATVSQTTVPSYLSMSERKVCCSLMKLLRLWS